MNDTQQDEPQEIVILLRWGNETTKTTFKAGTFNIVGMGVFEGMLTHIRIMLKGGITGHEEINMKIPMGDFWEDN